VDVRGLGTAVNVSTVLTGTTVGVLARRALPRHVKEVIPKALGVFTIALGIRQAMQTSNVLIMLGGLLSGVVVGSCLRLDDRLESLVSRSKDQMTLSRSRLHDAVVLPSLVFCVGPMTLLGAIQDGANAHPELLIVKAAMDGFASMAFAAALGAGVYLSAAVILVFQGGLTLAAGLVAPLLSERLVSEMTAAGGLIVISIGMKLSKVEDLPVADYLPALITTPLIVAVVTAVS